MLLNQGYVPCNKQIHIKIPENELQMIHDRMEQIGIKNMSAYIRKMAIDGYYIHIDFSELLEIIKLLKIDSNNINHIFVSFAIFTYDMHYTFFSFAKDANIRLTP